MGEAPRERQKRHEVPCHHSRDEYLDAWIAAARISQYDQVTIIGPSLSRITLRYRSPEEINYLRVTQMCSSC